jgi:hypothetical protein
MPYCLLGVMLGEYTAPTGDPTASPPENGACPCTEWQGRQSPATVKYRPRSIIAAWAGSAGMFTGAGITHPVKPPGAAVATVFCVPPLSASAPRASPFTSIAAANAKDAPKARTRYARAPRRVTGLPCPPFKTRFPLLQARYSSGASTIAMPTPITEI